MTVKEIRAWLAENHGVLPSQLFTDEQIEAHSTVAAKFREHESKNGELNRTIERRSAKDAMQAKVKDWTPDAQFYADTAFDGWSEATDDVAKLDDWLKASSERWKGRTGKDVVAPAPPDPADEWTAPPDGGVPSQPQLVPVTPPQPNQPPVAGGGVDPVTTAQRILGIVPKEGAA